MRREVELSRRRSIKLKAQVDKLQESREGVGWSQHRERVKVTHSTGTQCTSAQLSAASSGFISCSFLSQVTEEVLSILRLLHPLTEPESGLSESSQGENQLDVALAQLKNVARKLALSQTKQVTEMKLNQICTCLYHSPAISIKVYFSGHVT